MAILREISRKAEIVVASGFCYSGGPAGEYYRPDGTIWVDVFKPDNETGTVTGSAVPFSYEEYTPNNILG